MFWPDLTFIEFPTGGTCLVFFLFSKTKLMKGIVDVHLIVIIMTSFFLNIAHRMIIHENESTFSKQF